jgi:predicted Zn-dependent peptidase
MVFKGTARRTALDVNRDFDRLGANYNAFTSEENTLYFGAVLREFQTQIIELLADLMRPSLRQEDFDLEKQVILDEIARYEDEPHYRLYEKLMAEHFSGHPLGHSIMGTVESITALTRQNMLEYFNRRYSPGNITVAVVGNLDWSAVLDKVNELCSSWEPYEVGRDVSPAPRSLTTGTIPDKKLTRQLVGFMSPAPAAQDADRYAADLAATLLGDPNGSRLFYALIDPALADEAQMIYHSQDHAGAFVTWLSCDPDRTTQAVGIVRGELRRFLEEGPNEAEVLAAKNKIASAATIKGELPMGRLTSVGFDWMYHREYLPLSQEIDNYFAVTSQQVLETVRRYDLTATTVLGLGPAETL